MRIEPQHSLSVLRRSVGRPAAQTDTGPVDQALLSATRPPVGGKIQPGLGRVLIRESSYWARRIALGLVSPVAMLIGIGLGSSPAGLTGADQLHERGIDGRGVRVAIIDQGFTQFGAGSEDVVGVYNAHTGKFTDRLKPAGTDPAAHVATGETHDSFHGNAMAFIVTGETWGLRGVAPGAEVLGISVLDGNRQLTPKVFVDGLRWLVQNHQSQNIQAVSISLNYRNPAPAERDEAQRLISQLHREGVAVVVAAGNRGPDAGSIRFPGTAQDVVCVGSYTSGLIPGPYDDRLETHSGRGGNGIPGPTLVAPGGSVFTKDADGLVDLTSGTSNAVPMVVGGIALLTQAFPQSTNGERIAALRDTARPITGDPNQEGTGALSLEAAYEALAARYGEPSGSPATG